MSTEVFDSVDQDLRSLNWTLDGLLDETLGSPNWKLSSVAGTSKDIGLSDQGLNFKLKSAYIT